MKQITKNQHFVPRFYLKRFARDGQVHVFDVRAKRIAKPRSYTSVCYEKFFYAAQTGVQDDVSQTYEDVFGQIENVIANALPEIIERTIACQLTDDDLGVLAYFMSVQWLRTRYFRERLQKIETDLMKQVLGIRASHSGFRDYVRATLKGQDISEETIRNVQRMFQSGEYDLHHITNSSHLKFISEKDIHGFCNLFLAKRWRIIHAEEACHFITSDNPVAEHIPPQDGLRSVTFLDRQHLLAVTPGILVETTAPTDLDAEQPTIDRVSYFAANDGGVLMFNSVLAAHAHQFAYAPHTNEFERLLQVM